MELVNTPAALFVAMLGGGIHGYSQSITSGIIEGMLQYSQILFFFLFSQRNTIKIEALSSEVLYLQLYSLVP